MVNHQKILEEEVDKRTRQLRQAFDDLKTASQKVKHAALDTTFRLAQAGEYKDAETGSHIKRMGYYTEAIAKAMALAPQDIEAILYAAPMHDIGKIGIPDRILLKPGPLDEQEWTFMMQHTTIGGNILSGSDSYVIQMAEQIALEHHEKWDGSGYPKGLKGPDISLWGRISAIADVFDALTTTRPYKKAFPLDYSLEILEKSRGAHFDPDVVGAFFSIKEEILSIRMKYDEPDSEKNLSASFQLL
jgi:putative two-component system response regulator